MSPIVPERLEPRRAARSALPSHFWGLEHSSSARLDGVAWSAPGEPAPLPLLAPSGLVRTQELLALQALGAPAVPAWHGGSPGGGLCFDRALLSIGGPGWWAAAVGRFRAQKTLGEGVDEVRRARRRRRARRARGAERAPGGEGGEGGGEETAGEGSDDGDDETSSTSPAPPGRARVPSSMTTLLRPLGDPTSYAALWRFHARPAGGRLRVDAEWQDEDVRNAARFARRAVRRGALALKAGIRGVTPGKRAGSGGREGGEGGEAAGEEDGASASATPPFPHGSSPPSPSLLAYAAPLGPEYEPSGHVTARIDLFGHEVRASAALGELADPARTGSRGGGPAGATAGPLPSRVSRPPRALAPPSPPAAVTLDLSSLPRDDGIQYRVGVVRATARGDAVARSAARAAVALEGGGVIWGEEAGAGRAGADAGADDPDAVGPGARPRRREPRWADVRARARAEFGSDDEDALLGGGSGGGPAARGDGLGRRRGDPRWDAGAWEGPGLRPGPSGAFAPSVPPPPGASGAALDQAYLLPDLQQLQRRSYDAAGAPHAPPGLRMTPHERAWLESATAHMRSQQPLVTVGAMEHGAVSAVVGAHRLAGLDDADRVAQAAGLSARGLAPPTRTAMRTLDDDQAGAGPRSPLAALGAAGLGGEPGAQAEDGGVATLAAAEAERAATEQGEIAALQEMTARMDAILKSMREEEDASDDEGERAAQPPTADPSPFPFPVPDPHEVSRTLRTSAGLLATARSVGGELLAAVAPGAAAKVRAAAQARGPRGARRAGGRGLGRPSSPGGPAFGISVAKDPGASAQSTARLSAAPPSEPAAARLPPPPAPRRRSAFLARPHLRFDACIGCVADVPLASEERAGDADALAAGSKPVASGRALRSLFGREARSAAGGSAGTSRQSSLERRPFSALEAASDAPAGSTPPGTPRASRSPASRSFSPLKSLPRPRSVASAFRGWVGGKDEAWTALDAGVRVFASVGLSGSVGAFAKRWNDYTALSVRADVELVPSGDAPARVRAGGGSPLAPRSASPLRGRLWPRLGGGGAVGAGEASAPLLPSSLGVVTEGVDGASGGSLRDPWGHTPLAGSSGGSSARTPLVGSSGAPSVRVPLGGSPLPPHQASLSPAAPASPQHPSRAHPSLLPSMLGHSVTVSLTQQVYGPLRARLDACLGAEPGAVPPELRGTALGALRSLSRARVGVRDAAAGLDLTLPASAGAARIVAWYSPVRREGMVEIRLM